VRGADDTREASEGRPQCAGCAAILVPVVTTDAARLFEAIPSDVLAICERLRQKGRRCWIVGGCVRDVSRGADVADWDVATDARPEEVARFFEHVVPTGIQHGTVTVIRHGKHFEVTTLRGEGPYADGRRPQEVVFHGDIALDLARRDFTINAIALEPLSREIIDPFDGRGDLARKTLRAVGDPVDRFAEDGLRIMRAARFAATLEFDIAPSTLAAMALPRSLDTLRRVSAERVRDEWIKAMRARTPSICFTTLERTGALDVFCPELRATVGCPQGPRYTHDVWLHTLMTVDACMPDPILRVAALLHDIAKPATREHDFEGHDALGATMADAILRRLRFANMERARIVHAIRHYRLDDVETWSDAAVRRWIRRVTPEHVRDVCALARADAIARGRDAEASLERVNEIEARARREIASGHPISARQLAVRAGELMAALTLPPGPHLGKLLDALVEIVLDDPTANDHERLLDEARRWLAERAEVKRP
jgi:tRNA nucleotidyltransferase (CCA-adding enzyme)